MTDIPLFANVHTDNSQAELLEFTTVRALEASPFLDTSQANIDALNVQKAIRASVETDKSSTFIQPTCIKALSSSDHIDKSQTSVEFTKQRALLSEALLDRSESEVSFCVVSPLEASLHTDNTEFGTEFSKLHRLDADVRTDNSKFQVAEWTRYLLTEPPKGVVYVEVAGENVELSGYVLDRISSYGLNIQVQGTRLSKEGTNLIFRIKARASDTESLLEKRTDDHSISFVSCVSLDSRIEEYRAQVRLDASDFSILPRSNIAKEYPFELIWQDTLLESRRIVSGRFTLNP